MAIPCKVCDLGLLVPKQVHRMSGPVVIIGYILLIPMILGVNVCLFVIGASFVKGLGGGGADAISRNMIFWLDSLSVALGISFFVTGLLGWLLIMKKRILKCSVCGAVVNAS